MMEAIKEKIREIFEGIKDNIENMSFDLRMRNSKGQYSKIGGTNKNFKPKFKK